MSDYYDRSETMHVDGSPIFKSMADEKSERIVSDILEKHWNVEMRSFGKLSIIDWYAVRQGRLVGLAELKTRSHESSRFSTVFLNVRKWLALVLGSVGLGVPAMFVVRWTDCVKYISTANVNASKVKIGGCKKIVKSRNDIEPVIEVPVVDMVGVVELLEGIAGERG